jgi:acyl-CoA hydrolase/RimJ/RimL family protein N-acetyltransferase
MNRRKDEEGRIVPPEKVLKRIEPGMNIFLGTGVAEPRTLVRLLMESGEKNLQDLELTQLVSFGEAISLNALRSQNYRLKTFFSGWVASDAITEGRVDLIPSRFSRIPQLIRSGRIAVDAAFIQITPPNREGFCSLGVAVDVAREVMARAELVVGEINTQVPYTFGDTLCHMSEFDFLVRSTEPPIYFERWPVEDIYDRVAAKVASVVEDGSCIAFSFGPLFEGLGHHLAQKRDLGIHTPIFTDSLMELFKSGAVSNRRKALWQGKSLTSYAFGTPALMAWLNHNPLVEFQGIEAVYNPIDIGRNPKFVFMMPVRKVDLSGRIALHVGKGNVVAGPGEAMDFFNGAELSRGGLTIFALPSRNRSGSSNIRLSVEDFPNQFTMRESVDMVVTEYGVASLKGRSIRERAQALIDIAHPEDRLPLVEQAKEARILYEDQIFLAECAHLYPSEIAAKHTFKGGVDVRFRAIRPSDEEEMRRLFYRFSDEAVYYRYFSPVKTMPHAKMQEYVNVDCNQVISIVGVVGEPGEGRIIAEARFVKDPDRPYADLAFLVDEGYHGLGIASYMYKMLVRLAKERGIKGFTADILASNKAMLKVLEKGDLPVHTKLDHGAFEITIPFE